MRVPIRRTRGAAESTSVAAAFSVLPRHCENAFKMEYLRLEQNSC